MSTFPIQVADDDQAREARVRRNATRQGYALRKDRARSWNLDHFGGWMIIDANDNWIAAGERFDLTLEDVEAWLAEPT